MWRTKKYCKCCNSTTFQPKVSPKYLSSNYLMKNLQKSGNTLKTLAFPNLCSFTYIIHTCVLTRIYVQTRTYTHLHALFLMPVDRTLPPS